MKREIFAVSLRKDRKAKILADRRKRILDQNVLLGNKTINELESQLENL